MRYAIKQINAERELWLVRAASKGVWGASERAFGFFRRPTAERWVAKFAIINPGLSLEIVEVNGRDSAPAASSDADAGEPEATSDIPIDFEALEPQAA